MTDGPSCSSRAAAGVLLLDRISTELVRAVTGEPRLVGRQHFVSTGLHSETVIVTEKLQNV
jgi:hypothetical protein